jgi:hypothetical protein
MKAYQIITAGRIVAILFALDTADALATAKAQGITADNAIRLLTPQHRARPLAL